MGWLPGAAWTVASAVVGAGSLSSTSITWVSLWPMFSPACDSIRQPAYLSRLKLHIGDLARLPEATPEAAQGHHHAVRVVVHRRLVAGLVEVLKDPDALVLHHDMVEIGSVTVGSSTGRSDWGSIGHHSLAIWPYLWRPPSARCYERLARGDPGHLQQMQHLDVPTSRSADCLRQMHKTDSSLQQMHRIGDLGRFQVEMLHLMQRAVRHARHAASRSVAPMSGLRCQDRSCAHGSEGSTGGTDSHASDRRGSTDLGLGLGPTRPGRPRGVAAGPAAG